jgi:hypothetical protein
MALEQAHPGAGNLRTILWTRWRRLSGCLVPECGGVGQADPSFREVRFGGKAKLRVQRANHHASRRASMARPAAALSTAQSEAAEMAAGLLRWRMFFSANRCPLRRNMR